MSADNRNNISVPAMKRVLVIHEYESRDSDETRSRKKRIRDAVADCAELVANIVEETKEHDIGRLLAALDSLKQAADQACTSLTLAAIQINLDPSNKQ